jgi:hypothetical protein
MNTTTTPAAPASCAHLQKAFILDDDQADRLCDSAEIDAQVSWVEFDEPIDMAVCARHRTIAVSKLARRGLRPLVAFL